MGAKTEMDLFTIEQLEKISCKANNQGNIVTHPSWKRAYFRLVDAADRLIYMFKLSEEKVNEIEIKE